ncbi:uncharacterized protein SPSC_03950 [Sporisorium scitamineum]|uniref:SUZ domain-containing protein n=1 Tax=Sporisorium scitamineum TaxID=49012 RepID=A0A0F7S7R2_9BASI|nr:uncharacterized protein SPSC_03950 [Sporisorium scitamineum]CDW96925.1 hypothetical protein [Sporisorium scitamineum]
MEGQAGPSNIVATSKFKPSKPSTTARQAQHNEDVMDDWDAPSSDEEPGKVTAEAKQADVFKATKDQWTEANSQAPAALPTIAPDHGRSLPSAAYGHRLQPNTNAQARGNSAAAAPGNASITIAAAPPRILQRPKEAVPGMRSDGSSANASKTGSQEHKTVEQRQLEYRLARERIFGTTSSKPPSSGRGGKPSTR